MSAYPVYRRFSHYFRPQARALLLAAVLMIGSACVEPLIPAMMKTVLDHTSQAGTGKSAPWPWWQPPLVVVALFSARALFSYLANLSVAAACTKAVAAARAEMFARFLISDPQGATRESASTLINTIYTEAAVAVDSFRIILQNGVRDALVALALLGYLFWMNWRLTLLTLLVLPAVGLIVRKIGQRLQRVVREMQTAADGLNYVIEENTNAQRIVRLHRAQAQQGSRFERASEYLRGRQMRALAASAAMTPVSQITASVALALILSIALQQSEQGHLSVGGFAAYITAMLMLIPPTKSLGDVFPNIQRGRVALERMFRLMDSTLEPDTGTHQADHVRGAISFRGIARTYPGASTPAVHSIDLSIAARQSVALVGASGAGKTTLAYMIPRFVRPDAGTITLDDVPLDEWKLSSLRRHIAMVPQDTVLLNDTILANICLGEPVDAARARQALADAYLLEFVDSLPAGMDTVIGHNGQNLSGGQRQRMAIARALYKDSAILILDEATSALDAESERYVQQALTRLMSNRTTVIVAHRLSTIRHASLIVVMDGGRIVEQGDYAALMDRGGAFARLVSQQLQG